MQAGDDARRALEEENQFLRARIAELEAGRTDKDTNAVNSHDLLDYIPDACIVHVDGAIVYVNRRGIAMAGASSAEEVLGTSVRDWLSPDYLDLALEQRRIILEEKREIPPVELQVSRPDGRTVDVEVIGRPITWSGKTAILSVIRDISRRKRMEEALRSSEDRFHTMAAALPDVFWMVRPDMGEVYYTSPAFEQVWGLSIDEVKRRPQAWLESIHPEDRERMIQSVKTRTSEDVAKPTSEQEYRIVRPDGQIRWIRSRSSWARDKEGKVQALCGVARDVTDRKAAEQALRESEERFAKAFHSSPVAMSISELDTDRIIDVNKSFERCFGFDREETIGRTSKELNIWANPEERDRIVEPLTQHGSILEQEAKLLTRSGDLRICRWAGTKVTYRDTAHLIVVFDDVTERRRTEEALRDSERKYRLLIEGIPTVVWASDEEGNISYISANVEHVYGYTPKEICLAGSDIWLGRIHEDDRQRVTGRFRELISNGTPFDDVYRVQRRDGRWIWIHDRAAMRHEQDGRQYALGIFSDVSERREAEGALRESEKRYRILFESAGDAIFLMQEDRFIDCNQKSQEIFGRTRDELIGSPPYAFSPEVQPNGRDSREMARDMLKKVIEGEPQTFEWTHLTTDQKPFTTEVHLNRMEVADQAYVLAVVRDIQERKQAEEQRGRLASQLRQAQKMEALGTLAGGIAHDFNNVLSAISGFNEICLMDLSDQEETRSNLLEVRKACRRASDLVGQILTFSRQVEQQRKPVKLDSVVKEAIRLMRASMPSTIEIRQNIASELPWVLGDPTQIHQILVNLCANASHAMRENGGVLEVRLRALDLDQSTTSAESILKPGPHVQLLVSDTGIGMPLEIQDRIFDPYFTTKEKGEGTGLGLSVIRSIVESHQGTIRVESTQGKGTTFRVLLPAMAKRGDTEVPAEESAPKLEGKRILLVDDEEMVCRAVTLMLRKMGHDVAATRNAEKALELFRKDPNRFDLVISDMTMPHMTGDRLTQEILNLRPDMPVVLCTGYSDQPNRDRAEEFGAREVLNKPLAPTDLAQAIESALKDR